LEARDRFSGATRRTRAGGMLHCASPFLAPLIAPFPFEPLTHPGAEDNMSNIQLDIEWTEAASRKIEKLMPRAANKDAYLALPPVECLPMEGDVLFLGPDGKQQPFIVAERQYHHDGDADWTIILILDVPHETH
jgi:hypothetical protein